MTNTTVQAVKERLDNGEQLNIIDVRESAEYYNDNIGAILMPLSKLRNFEADNLEDILDQEIIVHCQSGKRSIEASILMEQMGFTNVVNLEGGIVAWRKAFGAENI
ncbi:NADH oxidase [Taibaiella sp. KBW10]|uniref:rhodanese-like domain-containing protein n=1 Tax=Taibaiella sp. KBW10 TaxID=2153357 RepID=UPI000F5B4FB1|nr:rhodanese-like domain-containing protein [Taibaiella sp. KBW10]RQO31030.1 NADH oxidase [Taibaiella sp. KBW10]